MGSPALPVLPFNIQYWKWQYRVKPKLQRTLWRSRSPVDILFLFLFISHVIQLTPQQQSAEPRNSAGAEALAVARRPKEASREKNPATAGIERFFSLKGPR